MSGIFYMGSCLLLLLLAGFMPSLSSAKPKSPAPLKKAAEALHPLLVLNCIHIFL